MPNPKLLISKRVYGRRRRAVEVYGAAFTQLLRQMAQLRWKSFEK